MYLCKECSKHKIFNLCRGDGYCDKHGRFAFGNQYMKPLCSQCAREKDICQKCGKKVSE